MVDKFDRPRHEEEERNIDAEGALSETDSLILKLDDLRLYVFNVLVRRKFDMSVLEMPLLGGGSIKLSATLLHRLYEGEYENEERLKEHLQKQFVELGRLERNFMVWSALLEDGHYRFGTDLSESSETEDMSIDGFLNVFLSRIQILAEEADVCTIFDLRDFSVSFLRLFNRFFASEFSKDLKKSFEELTYMQKNDEGFEDKLYEVLYYLGIVSALYNFINDSGVVKLVERSIN